MLVVRPDRIGDLVLSYPALRMLSRATPTWGLSLLTSGENVGIGRLAPGVERVIEWHGREVIGLVRRLRAARYDAVVFLRLRAPLTLAAFLAGIPIRLGPASHADHVLLTHRIVQRRHLSVRSEAEYNLEIAASALRLLGRAADPTAGSTAVTVSLPAEADARALDWLEAAFGPPVGGASRKIVGIHPGSGGSSRNWSVDRYVALGRAVESSGLGRVVVTGGPGEEGLVAAVESRIGRGCRSYLGLRGRIEAWALFSRLDALVSGSTGPMHLASAAGTPVVALFSPVIACSPVRWGARGPGAAVNLLPEVEPCERCRASRCPEFDCMDRIRVEEVLEALTHQLTSPGQRREWPREALPRAQTGGLPRDAQPELLGEQRLPVA